MLFDFKLCLQENTLIMVFSVFTAVRSATSNACHGDVGYVADPHNCSRFYQCFFFKEVPKTCPNGLVFNPILKVCDWSNNVNCQSNLTPLSQQTSPIIVRSATSVCQSLSDGLYANTEDCSAFYSCAFGVRHDLQCPAGLHFNSAENICDWPENVNCRPQPPPINSNDLGVISGAIASHVIPSMKTDVAQFPRSTERGKQFTSAMPSTPNTCENRLDGLYPESHDCSMFYSCSSGLKYSLQCPAGLQFNADKNVCDWPRNVGCRATVSPIKRSANILPDAFDITSVITSGNNVYGNISQDNRDVSNSSDVNNSGCQRMVCYFTNWSQYRPGAGSFKPEDIDPSMCTHLIFAFAKLVGNSLGTMEWNDDFGQDGLYHKVISLKNVSAGLKIMLGVGGWNVGSMPFTRMVSTEGNRREFAYNSADFLAMYGFDGLELDWEYPTARGSPAVDKQRFAELVKVLRTTYDDYTSRSGTDLMLTAAVPASKNITDSGYMVSEIIDYLDFVNLMAYDFHGGWDAVTGHNSPLFPHSSDKGNDVHLNVDWAAQYWTIKGCPRHKLVLGVPLYGRSFTLRYTDVTGVDAPVVGSGSRGRYTQEPGLLSYYEVCTMKTTSHVVQDPEMRVPYLVSGDQWVGYDDVASIANKVRYARQQGYGGIMGWSLSMDDFSGKFCSEGRYPLWTAVVDECGR